MNLVLLQGDELANGATVTLNGRRARHLISVCRVEPGKVLRVGELNGRTGKGTVRSMGADSVTLDVELSDAPAPAPSIDAVLAIPRPQMLKRILESAPTLGIRRLALVYTRRVERGYMTSPVLRPERIREHLELGLEQAMTTFLPEVSIHNDLAAYLNTGLSPEGPRIAADVESAEPLSAFIPLVTDSRVTIALGPEGGYVPRERELLDAHGFRRVSLGPRVLRVETALPFLVGQIELARATSTGE